MTGACNCSGSSWETRQYILSSCKGNMSYLIFYLRTLIVRPSAFLNKGCFLFVSIYNDVYIVTIYVLFCLKIMFYIYVCLYSVSVDSIYLMNLIIYAFLLDLCFLFDNCVLINDRMSCFVLLWLHALYKKLYSLFMSIIYYKCRFNKLMWCCHLPLPKTSLFWVNLNSQKFIL